MSNKIRNKIIAFVLAFVCGHEIANGDYPLPLFFLALAALLQFLPEKDQNG